MVLNLNKQQMKKAIFTPALAAIILFFSSCGKDDFIDTIIPTPVVKPDIVFFGISSSNQLIKYNAKATENVAAQFTISGLQAAETILAIDFRPATGQLYGLGSSSRIYVINVESGVARPIGATAFTPAISGTVTGFDFNPTVDRIRLVTNTGQNLRLNPETGGVAATDATINPAATLIGAAYTNSFAGAATTVLYDIDGQKLYKQDPPNNGTLVEVGSLGVVSTGSGDFDISPDNKVILAPLTVNGTNSLYQVDTATGKATNLGALATPIIGLAIPTNAVAYSTDNSNNLLIFNLVTPATPVTKAIVGLQVGENILGIDMRPATGQLYALGSTSRLYTINMASGAATVVGTAPFTTLLSGTSFGFDFNPTVDRIRVVSNSGQNLRLDPNTGLIAAIDLSLNPGAPAVSAAAYTNNFAGTTTTALYVIDPSTDRLYLQNPPNNGTLVDVGALGINVETDNGFDIGGRTNMAYALLTVGTTTKIYSINLSTGAATSLADFTGTAKGFSVGLGF
jgi:Domain of unknown function (DUF4394)